MSYKPDTILELKEPRSTDDKPFAYDRVRVIGESPMNYGPQPGEWGAAGGKGIVIQPAGEEFGPNLDEPLGKLQSLYKVVSEPPPVVIRRGFEIEVPDVGPSPEEVFAAAAEEQKNKPAPKARKAKTANTSPEEDFAREPSSD